MVATPLANRLSTKSKYDNAIIVGSEIRAALQEQRLEIERLTTEVSIAKEYGKVCDSEAVLAEKEIERLTTENESLRAVYEAADAWQDAMFGPERASIAKICSVEYDLCERIVQIKMAGNAIAAVQKGNDDG